MAARLTVIVSQSARREGRLVDLEETLVTELMMSPGMDATLVGPLENIRPDSTDYLCLNGFQHSLALVSWLEEESVREHWDRLALGGTVRRYGSRDAQTPAVGRIIYFFQLAGDMKSSAVLAEIANLQNDRSVKTVSLNMLTLPASSSGSLNGATVAAIVSDEAESPVRGERLLRDTTSSEASQDSNSSASPASGQAAVSFPGSASGQPVLEEEEDWESLDRLVEDFDALDL